MLGRKPHLKKAPLKESREILGENPGRGWYHLYYHMAEQEPDYKEMEKSLEAGESLALPVINIGYFRHEPVSVDGLRHIDGVLDFYQKHGKELVLRFSYDTEGKGSEREPWDREILLGHMAQLGEAVKPYRNNILVVQGLFIGSWGEMHGSRYLTEGSMKKLLAALRQALGPEIPIALRRPSQMRMVQYMDENICLYNDGMFGSENDLGTYGAVSRREAKEGAGWLREEELDWQEDYVDGKPNGGETVAAPEPVGFVQASKDMERMHVSYLNSFYHAGQLGHWKKEQVRSGVFKGMSGFDYIGAHLGYRFVVRRAALTSGSMLEVSLGNEGFAANCDEAACRIEAAESGGMYRTLAEELLPAGKGRGEWKMSFPLGDIQGLKGNLYFSMSRTKDGKSIRLANEGAGERVMLGMLG